jgi:2-iminobutanoate/2-iminopropanoate deaminase
MRAGDLLITSGQVGIADGAIVEGGLPAQARQALDNLKALVEGEGASLNDVVKTVVFLTSMDDYATMNDIYLEYFDEHRPARSAVAVAALPLGAVIEVEAVAYKPV